MPRPDGSPYTGVSNILFWISIGALGCTSAPFDRAFEISLEPYESLPPTFVEELPIEFNNDLLIVQVRVDGYATPLRLALDTGAPTAIRSDLSGEFVMTPDDSWGTARTFDVHGRPLAFETALLPGLKLGRLSLIDVPAALIQSTVFDLFCPPIDGLLGTRGGSGTPGFLDRVAVEIDQDREVVRILGPELAADYVGAALPMDYTMTSMGTKEYATELRVPVLLNDVLVWAEVDSGGGGLSRITLDAFLELGRTTDDNSVRRFRGVDSIAAGGVGPARTSWVAIIEDVQFGGVSIGAVAFRVVEDRKGEEPNVRLGQDVLGRVNMLINYGQNELRVRARDSRWTNPVLRTQMMWAPDSVSGRLAVAGLLDDGAGQLAGVQLGDELMSVNGVRIEGRERDSWCAAASGLRIAEGEVVKLRLRRGDEEFEVAVPREESFGDSPDSSSADAPSE